MLFSRAQLQRLARRTRHNDIQNSTHTVKASVWTDSNPLSNAKRNQLLYNSFVSNKPYEGRAILAYTIELRGGYGMESLRINRMRAYGVKRRWKSFLAAGETVKRGLHEAKMSTKCSGECIEQKLLYRVSYAGMRKMWLADQPATYIQLHTIQNNR